MSVDCVQPVDGLDATATDDPSGPRGIWWARVLLRVVFGVHAGLAVTQPLLAGSYLSGNLDAMRFHSAIGGNLSLVGLLALIVAALFWQPGRGPGWPALAMIVVFVAEVLQAGAGYSRTLGLHIPLGVGIVGTTVFLFGWSLVARLQPRPRRRTADQAVVGTPPGPA